MTTATPSNRHTGRRAGEDSRDATHAMLAERRAAIVRRAQRALLTALLAMDSATADDVRDLVDVPVGIDPVCLGAAPGPLARAGIIRRIGWEPTCRPMAHARPVSRWAMLNRSAALRWLVEHPDLPDPAEGAGPGATLFG